MLSRDSKKGTGLTNIDHSKSKSLDVLMDLNPNICAPWLYHDRGPEWFESADLDELTQSIKSNGQLQPGLCRVIPEGRYPEGHRLHGKRYEIVFGACRHYGVIKSGLPKFQAVLKDLSDEDCFVLMEEENAKRKDVKPMERAKTWYLAYTKTFKEIAPMVVRYNKSKATLSKGIKAGILFFTENIERVLSSSEIRELTVKDCGDLADLIKSDPSGFQDLLNSDKIETIKNSSPKIKIYFLLDQLSNEKTDNKKSVTRNGISGSIDKSGKSISLKLPTSLATGNKRDLYKHISQVVEELTAKK